MSSPDLQFAGGEIFAGRYRLDRLLGSGGMAHVYGAHDLATKTDVAVKILRGEAAKNQDIRLRFMREADLLRALSHPSIVAVQTYGETEDGRTFLIMERLRGETLRHFLRREGRLTVTQVTPILAHICQALTAAHGHGVVHRDLKPANVFLAKVDDGVHVKVLDFGISKIYGMERITEAGEVLGTPRYMAPEQLTGAPDVDQRADIYALGIILYEALSGVSPFDAESPNELLVAVLRGDAKPLRNHRPDLNEAILSVVARAMSLDRSLRFETSAALLAAWLDAAKREPTAVDLGPKPFTLAVGSFPPDDDVEEDNPVVAFTPGTFSNVSPKEVQAAAKVAAAAEVGLASTVPQRPQRPQAAGVDAPPADAADESAPELPARRPVWIWAAAVVVALVFAALSAVLVRRLF